MEKGNSFMNVNTEADGGALARQATSPENSWRSNATNTERRLTQYGADYSSGSELEAILDTTAGPTVDEAGKKRKASPTELREIADDALVDLAAKLDLAWHRLKGSLWDITLGSVTGPNGTGKRAYLAMAKAVKDVVDYSNAAHDRTAQLAQEEETAAKPETAESSTDTDLTPHWWSASTENDKDTPLADLERPRARTATTRRHDAATAGPTPATKTYASAVGRSASPDSADDGAEGEYTMVTRRPKILQQKPGPRARDRPRPLKPPAVLIRVAEGETFDSTLRAVRSAVDPGEIGVDIKKVSRTQGGHLLVELKGGPKAADGAAAFSKAVEERTNGRTGGVVQLGTSLEIEIVDLDPGVEEEEVRAALVAAIVAPDDPDSEATRSQVALTGFWRLRSGVMIATAKIPQTAAKLEALKVGWTVAKVRPRRPEPIRCYRCLGFGHSSIRCKGPDLTDKCRKCGGSGHQEKTCGEEDKCVACDRLGLAYTPHRSGSSGCLAKRRAIIRQA